MSAISGKAADGKNAQPVINPRIFEYDTNISRRILRFLGPHRWKLVLGFILMFTSVFHAIFGPALIGRAVDDGLARGDLSLMSVLVVVYLVISFVSQVSTKFQIQVMVRLGQTVIRDMRQVLYEHVQELSMSFFARYEVGGLISRIMGDVQWIREFITFALFPIVPHLSLLRGLL